MRIRLLLIGIVVILVSFTAGYLISSSVHSTSSSLNSAAVTVSGSGITSIKPIFNPPLAVDTVGVDESILIYTIQGKVVDLNTAKIPATLKLQTTDGKIIGPFNIDTKVNVIKANSKNSATISSLSDNDDIRTNLTYSLYSDGSYNSSITFIYIK